MKNKYSISDTTKEERKEIVKEALEVSLTGVDMPTNETLHLARQYVNGNIEIKRLQEQVVKKYKEDNQR